MVEDWAAARTRGAVDRQLHGAGRLRAPPTRTVRCAGVRLRGLRSLVEDLARDLDVERVDVASVEEVRGGAQVVVLAMPDPQARRLTDGHPVADVLDRAWEPVIAVAARWPSRIVGRREPVRTLRRCLRQRRPGDRLDRRRRPPPGRRRAGPGRALDLRAGRAPPRRAVGRGTGDRGRAPSTARASTSRRTPTSTDGPSPARPAAARRRTPSSTGRAARWRCAVTAGVRRRRSRRPGCPAPASDASWLSDYAVGTPSRARAGSRSTRPRGSRPAARPRSRRRRW